MDDWSSRHPLQGKRGCAQRQRPVCSLQALSLYGLPLGDEGDACYCKNLDLDFRTLETFFGSVVAKFEPNSAISTLLGMGATKGDGQMQTPTAKHVLALIAKSLSENLNNAIWSGKRNPSGDTTEDLFDGFDTITQQDIVAGRIAASEGNYIKLTDEITSVNAVDIAKHILWSLDPRLRSQDLIMYCSQDFVDKYNEAYLLSHGGIGYNLRYDQQTVEGSNGKLKMVPLFNKQGSYDNIECFAYNIS